ncbi:MAG: hypothetical protein CMG60_03685 [Candidatus Marinimicrobia bacterium]|nr:hypothetical protein [Candidatus Neomarinimicrobiota bacterium]
MQKRLIFFIFVWCCAFGQIKKTNPIMQSLIIPGWGQKTLGKKKTARIFSSVEISLWTACAASYLSSYNEKLKYTAFAAQYAGVESEDKGHKYWVDIGNYLNIEQHNAEHLRWREFDELYNENDRWQWNEYGNMQKFEEMRIKSDYLKKTGEYILGTIILNHIISGINTLYILRSENITFTPVFTYKSSYVLLSLSF